MNSVIQINGWTWFVEYGFFILLITAVPAYLFWFIGSYVEAVVYNSHTPNPVVPENSRQKVILEVYQNHRHVLDLLLLSFFMSGFIFVLLAGGLLGGIQGLALGIVVGFAMISHLRHGLHLEERIRKKLEAEKDLFSGEAKLFG